MMKPLGLSAYAVAKAIGASPIAISEKAGGERGNGHQAGAVVQRLSLALDGHPG
jgi:predicted transcriptional regulator